MVKSNFKCPKCRNSTLFYSICEDNIVVLSCSHQYANKSFCGYYEEMYQIKLFIEKIDK